MNDFQREIYKTIDILTEQKLRSLGFDRTRRGRVVSINGVECVVQIDGENYTCKLRRGIYVELNDIVFVKFPQNSSVDKYVETILGGNETPENLVISAEEILDKLKTVDGEGSGLDADLLDGKHGSEYATKEDLDDINIDISGETIVENINLSTAIIDDKNLSANINDTIDKKHSHSNKDILDTITQNKVDNWDTVSNKSDIGHKHTEADISDLDKYTKSETDIKLNIKADKVYVDNELSNKVDKVAGKGLSTEDYTTGMKDKLINIEDGAEKNKVNSVNSKTGDVVIAKSDIGLGNVDNKSSATIRGEITNTNITNALGYTPENSSSKGIADGYAPLDSNIKVPLSMLPDVAKQQTYVVEAIADRDSLTGLIMGEKCYVTGTGDSYIWDGAKWVTLAKADWENVNLQWTNIVGKPQSSIADIDDATTKRHMHTNKSIIDTITQTLISRWNSAWTHISDNIKHITSSERSKWNTVDNKADSTYVDVELGKKQDSLGFTPLKEIPVATTTKLGGIKVGTNLSITADGTLSAVDDDSKTTFIVKQELFTATEGQTLFNLTKGNYQPNTNTISVYLYGGKQPNISISEVSTSSFRIIEPLKAGNVVLVEYIELSSATPYPIHGSDHLLDGYDPIPLATASKEGLMSKGDKSKLDDIENGANNYTHPNTHPASMITESTTKRFVSDNEKSTWNSVANKTDKAYVDGELQKYVPLSGNSVISGTKTFSDVLKNNGIENFNDVYVKRALGRANVGTTYANLDSEIRTGGYHRFWKIAFPSGTNFWGKVKISLYGTYSSFNSSGKMAKEINVNFNGATMYSNVGCYTELSGFVEKDFRISEAIWNSETSQWEFWIYSHQLQGNNTPYIYIEGWANGTNYINTFNGITFNETPVFLQNTTYENARGNSAGQNLIKSWTDLPTYQNPYGNTIASLDDLPTKLSGLTKDINFDERYYTETETNNLLSNKVDNSRVLSDVPLNAKFTDTNTTYSEISTAEIDSGTASTLRTITARRVQYILDKVSTMISTAISTLTKSSVGLGNVDNTSDINKPISTATQTALNGKVNNSQVLTNVPSGAKFTDTITTINGKTGTIGKADIVALGIPAQDTVYTHPSSHPASMITESANRRFTTDLEKASWNSKGVVNIGTFNSQQELIGYVIMNQLPTGQYTFSMSGYSYFMLLRDWGSYYNGVFQDSEGIFAYFDVTKTGTINELMQSDIKDLGYLVEDMQFIMTNKVDKVAGKQLSSEDYTTVEKNKLANIQAGANKYTHPSTHPASMILESTTNRFASDAEKNSWNSKAEISDIPTKVGQLQNDKNYVTHSELGEAGLGDMSKGVYDTNNNGKVDIAEVAETVIGNEIQLGGRFKIVYNDIEDSLDIEVI